ncbi:hypothetical protein JAAARDRAFT_595497 [Jaapia argillacea MUCL 33604]|uniref:Uncharacterized protein n=1 Tax=Jaapia argillacea MUCL 33604 TaxID=933084 RepID=A0A067QBV6_9AGAM|nr:hypothetical protein JAAARDRAFT_595497 [Jaapia argillacea MUCL 33604]
MLEFLLSCCLPNPLESSLNPQRGMRSCIKYQWTSPFSPFEHLARIPHSLSQPPKFPTYHPFTFTMKFFSLLPTFCLAALSGLSCVLAAPTTNSTSDASITVITSIQSVATTSGNLNTLCGSINFFNIAIVGPQIAFTLQKIVTSVATATAQIIQMGPNPVVFSNTVAVQVVVVLTSFVKIHQLLLSTIIGKHGFLAQFGFAAPVRLALVAIEGGVDAFAFALIKLIPTQSSAAVKQVTMLKASLNVAITTYN